MFSGTFSGDGSALVGVASTDNIQTGTAATFTSTVDVSDGTLIIPNGDTASRTGINNGKTTTSRGPASRTLIWECRELLVIAVD